MGYIDDVGRSYYEVLGVTATSTLEEIKQGYRQTLLRTHPDKVGGDSKQIEEITQAYSVLRDPDQRKQYDADFKKSVQKLGFNVNGSGLDTFSLEDFVCLEDGDEVSWVKDCPRCQDKNSMRLSEYDLEHHGTDDGEGGLNIIVQCGSCSLWIKVSYQVDEEV